MDHKEWHNWRLDGIGGSDIGVIMGTIPLEWNTPYKLWKEKTYKIPQLRDSSAMKRGRDREPEGRAKFEELTGEVVFGGKRKIHPNFSFMRANLDGIDIDEKTVVEIKWPNKEDHLVAAGGKVPEKYYPQCQHILFVTELQTMHYLSCSDEGVAHVVVDRDEEFIKKMLDAAKKFWHMVETRTPPEKTIYDFELMIDNDTWKEREEDLLKTNEEIKSLEKKREELKSMLIEAAGDQSAEGRFLRLSHIESKGAINYQEAIEDYLDKLKKKYPNIELESIDVEKFRKPSFTKWQIRSIA